MAQKSKNSPVARTKQNHILSADMVIQQLQRICDSPEFDGTTAQRAFLHYVIKKTIEGKSDEIKGYSVATEVFGRHRDFDQNRDPIVSIQANRLRRALERYYLIAGQQDPIRIDIPKGSYVPVFTPQTGTEKSATPTDKRTAARVKKSWPTILILPFKNLTGNPGRDFIGNGLSTELAVELSRFGEIKVLFPSEEQIAHVTTGDVRFFLDGSIYEDSTGLKITAHLIENKTGKQIWADTHRSNFDPEKFFTFQEKVVQAIVSKITGESGIIPKVISIESGNKPPTELSTYEAILRFYDYDQTLTPESFIRAMAALRHAAVVEPGCSQVWSLLARLYANIHSLDYPGFEDPLEKAIEYAEKGVRINPNNQRNVTILALVRFFSNELSSALNEVDRAFELNPNSLLFLDCLAYIMILAGEWKRGAALARKVIKLNPYYRPVLHYALWVDWLRQEKYDRAFLETMGLRRPAVFWYPLSKAATLGLLGRYEEGEKFVEKLLVLRPDFPNKGRVLIERYIKFQGIIERVIEGLNKVGLRVN
jgi:TolB-like protein/tetratricopeptide (TPR) repeat protein